MSAEGNILYGAVMSMIGMDGSTAEGDMTD